MDILLIARIALHFLLLKLRVVADSLQYFVSTAILHDFSRNTYTGQDSSCVMILNKDHQYIKTVLHSSHLTFSKIYYQLDIKSGK